MTKVTREAGTYLHWSGDSKQLHWSLGPELYTRDLKDAFAFLDGAPEKLPEPPAHGVNIGFKADADGPTGTVALVGGAVITMKGDEVIEDGTVVVEGNRIAPSGRRGQVPVPAGAKVVDVAGKTIIPGLVDVHWHGAFGTDDIIPQENWVTYANLGLRRDHPPRPVERHRHRLRGGRDARGRADHRAAHLLDRHDPLRRHGSVHGRGRQRSTTPASTSAA